MRSIRGVVFDLDGTLADTEHLGFSERLPSTLLAEPLPADPRKSRWATSGVGIPGRLLARGYRVAVITRSPAPYAWTLSWLLSLDHEQLVAGRSEVGTDPAGKLLYLASRWGLRPNEILYVGDTPADREQARQARCFFRLPWWRIHGHEEPDLPGVRNPIPIELIQVPLCEGRAEPLLSVVDDAVQRLTTGAASDEDYELLCRREYHSFLTQYGDPERLPADLAAIRTSNEAPPWTNPRSEGVWADLVRTGDANRLIDMDQAMLMFRLPDPMLDAALAREASTGAYAILERTLRDLDPYVQKRIALPPRPVSAHKRLERELRALNSAHATATQLSTSPLLSTAERCRIALQVLAADPGTPARRELQLTTLRHLPMQAGPCLIQKIHDASGQLQTPGLPGWFVTRGEYDADSELRMAVLQRLSDWFPLQSVARTHSQACVAYRGGLWGDCLWRLAKDWRGTRSAQSVFLAFVELPALVLAGHVLAIGAEVVVAAPSTPFSREQPAELSARLARRISQLSGVPFEPVLRKTQSGGIELAGGAGDSLRGRRVVVVDDQATRGETFQRCAAALKAVRARELGFLSWSNSSAVDTWGRAHQLLGCWSEHNVGTTSSRRLRCHATPLDEMPAPL